MKKIGSAEFWIGVILVVLVVAGMPARQSPAPDAGQRALAISTAPAAGASMVERGRYLADAGNCMSCHTRPGAAAFSGGVPFTTALGTIYSSNITPNDQTGIGQWHIGDFRRAMHEGIGAGGRHLFPAFPYTSFTKVSDADVDAIYVYLRAQQPVRYTPPTNGFIFRQRWGMVLWNLMFFTPERFDPIATQSAEWNRGAYLVQGLGHCDACHSPRNLFLAEIASRAYSGGAFQEQVSAGRIRRWSGVNLTSSRTGLGDWSVENLAKYLETGVCPRAGVFGPMNEVVDNSLKNLSVEDVHAMAVYLKSLPAKGSAAEAPPEIAVKAGAQLYSDHCEECHMASGRGGFLSAPPLAGSAVVQASDPSSMINVILYGADQPKDISFGGWQTMKPYRDVLNDAEVAAVSNYLRGSWKNRASAVTPSDVARQR